jgi:hypothetical protein
LDDFFQVSADRAGPCIVDALEHVAKMRLPAKIAEKT